MNSDTGIPEWLTSHAKISGDDFWTQRLEDEEQLASIYANYALTVPSDPRVIFYESMSGSRMDGNPYAVFRYLYNDPNFENHIHIWSSSNKAAIPKEYRKAANIVFTRRDTRAYAYLLALAGHIIVNSTLPDFFVRKYDQKYLNTWHGIPYKMVGRGSRSSIFGSAPGMRNLFAATHLLTPCQFSTDIQAYSYSLSGAASGTMAETGYPRIDLTLNATEAEKAALRKRLKLAEPGNDTAGRARPLVLYAPTWRADGSDAYFDSDQLEQDLEALSRLDADVVFRGHPRTVKFLKQISGLDVIVPPLDITTNELLAITDILITDYSSVFFDFLATDRPIIHYLYDLDSYTKERGLNLTVDELPGTIAYTEDDLVTAVASASAALHEPISARYAAAKARFAPHDDGHSTERAVNFFFNGDSGGLPTTDLHGEKRSILFWGGNLKNSAASLRFLQRVHAFADKESWNVTLLVSRKTTRSRQAFASIRALPDSVAVIGVGKLPTLVADIEQSAWDRRAALAPTDTDSRRLCASVYERRYRQILGAAWFDSVEVASTASREDRELAKYATLGSPRITTGKANKIPVGPHSGKGANGSRLADDIPVKDLGIYFLRRVRVAAVRRARTRLAFTRSALGKVVRSAGLRR